MSITTGALALQATEGPRETPQLDFGNGLLARVGDVVRKELSPIVGKKPRPAQKEKQPE